MTVFRCCSEQVWWCWHHNYIILFYFMEFQCVSYSCCEKFGESSLLSRFCLLCTLISTDSVGDNLICGCRNSLFFSDTLYFPSSSKKNCAQPSSHTLEQSVCHTSKQTDVTNRRMYRNAFRFDFYDLIFLLWFYFKLLLNKTFNLELIYDAFNQ